MVLTKSMKFKNATISREDMTITELSRDEERVYSLENVLREWDGIENISINISLNSEISEDAEERNGDAGDGD